jgi:prepilin-type N-terminal cleavage/methylation domain-containing protein
MKKALEVSGFTLVELMVVIMIIGVLAAATVPILRGRAERAKWSEGAASAGSIRKALRTCYAEDPAAAMAMVGNSVDAVQGALGFSAGDLTGMYFQASDFTITAIDGDGLATITVSAPAGLTGFAVLGNTGWVYTP